MRPLLQVRQLRGRQRARLERLYRTTRCRRTRTGVQMVLLCQAGHSLAEIARITC